MQKSIFQQAHLAPLLSKGPSSSKPRGGKGKVLRPMRQKPSRTIPDEHKPLKNLEGQHEYRILLLGASASGKTRMFFSLVGEEYGSGKKMDSRSMNVSLMFDRLRVTFVDTRIYHSLEFISI